MKKKIIMLLALVFICTCLAACDKNKKDVNKKDSTKSESTKDSSAETDYKVRADREIMDESATLTVFATSFSEYNNLAEKLSDKDKEVIELQAEEGMEFRKELDSLSWFNAEMAYSDFLENPWPWVDAVLKYEESNDKYYISFGSGSVIHVIPEEKTKTGKMSESLLKSFSELCSFRTQGLEFDEKGQLTEDSCVQYVRRCLTNYLEYFGDEIDTKGFSKNDNQDEYVVSFHKLDYEGGIDPITGELLSDDSVRLIVEKPKNWDGYAMFEISRKGAGILSGTFYEGRPDLYKAKADITDISYEGRNIDYTLNETDSPDFSDGHFGYYLNYATGCISTIMNLNGYRPEPVGDIIKDAKEYLEKLFPGSALYSGEWETEEIGVSRIVKFITNIYGYPLQTASFVYDEENRFTAATLQMELLIYIKDENDLIKLYDAVKLAEEYLKKEYPELNDYNATAHPEMMNDSLVWIVRLTSGEKAYTCVLNAVSGDQISLAFEIADE